LQKLGKEVFTHMQTKIQSSPLPASGKGVQVSDDQIEQLRSVLARTYEKRQPSPFRLVQAMKD